MNSGALPRQHYLSEQSEYTQRGFIVTCFDTDDLGANEESRPRAVKETVSLCVSTKQLPGFCLLIFHRPAGMCMPAYWCVSQNPNVNVTWHARVVTFLYTQHRLALYLRSRSSCSSSSPAFSLSTFTTNVYAYPNDTYWWWRKTTPEDSCRWPTAEQPLRPVSIRKTVIGWFNQLCKYIRFYS